MHLENRWLITLDVELHDAGLLSDHLWGWGRRGEHLHAGLLRHHLQQTPSDALGALRRPDAIRHTPMHSDALRRTHLVERLTPSRNRIRRRADRRIHIEAAHLGGEGERVPW